MQHVDALFVADGGKACLSPRTTPGFPSPSEQTLRNWNRARLFDGIAAFFAQMTSKPKSHSGNALGKYDPFLTLY